MTDDQGLRVNFYLPDPEDGARLQARAKRSGLTVGQMSRLLTLEGLYLNRPRDPREDAISDLETSGDRGESLDLPL